MKKSKLFPILVILVMIVFNGNVTAKKISPVSCTVYMEVQFPDSQGFTGEDTKQYWSVTAPTCEQAGVVLDIVLGLFQSWGFNYISV